MTRLNTKCNYFQSAAVKFKSCVVKYYQLVEDLKDMIRFEKKWTTQDFDEKVKQFKYSRRRKSGGSFTNLSMDDAEPTGRDTFENDDQSEDDAEFEAKRVKDAENKIFQDIFGGKVGWDY